MYVSNTAILTQTTFLWLFSNWIYHYFRHLTPSEWC